MRPFVRPARVPPHRGGRRTAARCASPARTAPPGAAAVPSSAGMQAVERHAALRAAGPGRPAGRRSRCAGSPRRPCGGTSRWRRASRSARPTGTSTGNAAAALASAIAGAGSTVIGSSPSSDQPVEAEQQGDRHQQHDQRQRHVPRRALGPLRRRHRRQGAQAGPGGCRIAARRAADRRVRAGPPGRARRRAGLVPRTHPVPSPGTARNGRTVLTTSRTRDIRPRACQDRVAGPVR